MCIVSNNFYTLLPTMWQLFNDGIIKASKAYIKPIVHIFFHLYINLEFFFRPFALQ